jgi:ubiquinol-cytochrome c reductase subunit 6
MGILDFIADITSAFSVTPVDADAPQADKSADRTSGSENQDEGEEKDVNSKEENSEDGDEEEGGEEQEEEEEEEEPEDIKQQLEEGKSNSLTLRLSSLYLGM